MRARELEASTRRILCRGNSTQRDTSGRAGVANCVVLASLIVLTVACVLPLSAAAAGSPWRGQDCFYTENWEFGAGDWIADALWEIGTPTGEPDTASSGVSCAGTNLSGDYPETCQGRLYRTFDFTGINLSEGEELTLTFFQWIRTYDNNDFGCVEADTGTGWFELPVYGLEAKRFWDGAVWSRSAVDLSPLAGQTVALGFYFKAQDTSLSYYNSSRGWYIDDIRICSGVIPPFFMPEGFEEGWGDWWATNGLWEVGEPDSGPGGGYRGDKCMCSVLNGDYPEVSGSYLVTPPLALPELGVAGEIVLRYASWFSTYDESDTLRILVSENGGPWVVEEGPYYGPSCVWSTLGGVSLSDYANSTVRVAFDIRGNDTSLSYYNSAYGWCLDQVYLDGIRLIVVDTDPVPGAVEVPVTSSVRVNFGNLVDSTTVNTSTFVVTGSSGPIDGTFQFAPNKKSFFFHPSSPLTCEDTITCLLTDDIFDLDGQRLDGDGDWTPGGDYEWTFATATCPLTVTSLYPPPGATDVSPLDSIVVEFNYSVDPTSLTGTSWPVKDRTGNGIDGEYSVNADSTQAIFKPLQGVDHYFVFGDSVTSCLFGGIKGAAGDSLLADTCWSFTVLDSSVFAIMGTVVLFGDEWVPIPSVVMDIEPGDEDSTDANGRYAFLELAAESYVVSPTKTGDQRDAISAEDASLAARAAVGLVDLESMAERAADVTGNEDVSAYDAALIAQWIVGLISGWPTGEDWCFTPDSVSYEPLTLGKLSEDYVAAVTGDVNGSWPGSGLIRGGRSESGTRIALSENGQLSLRNELGETAWGLDFVLAGGLPIEDVAALVRVPAGGSWSLVVGPPRANGQHFLAYGTTGIPPGGEIVSLDFSRMLEEKNSGEVAVLRSYRINETRLPDVTILWWQSDSAVLEYALRPVRGNPISDGRSTVAIHFALANPGPASLRLYDVRGALVNEKTMPRVGAGDHVAELSIRGLASGVYFYRLKSGAFQATRKLVIAH